jgi:lipoprotein-anchoring transpeptidase ErfK/SrfK
VKRIALVIGMITVFLIYLGVKRPAPVSQVPHIIVVKAHNRLYFFNHQRLVHDFPVATGELPTLTPEGSFVIGDKAVNPLGLPLDDSVYGSHWLGLSHLDGTDTKYGIHGTNEPSSIGFYVSKGCIRMRNEDIEALYPMVEQGTRVYIQRGFFYGVRRWVNRLKRGAQNAANSTNSTYALLSK